MEKNMKKEKEIKNLDNQQKAKIPLVTTEAQLMPTAEVDNNNQNDLSCSLIGGETKNDEFICIEEALKLLDVSEDTFRKKYLPKLKESDIKKTTANTGGKKMFYERSTILRLKEEEEENQRVVKIQSKATNHIDVWKECYPNEKY